MVIQPTLVKYPTFPLHVVVALTSKTWHSIMSLRTKGHGAAIFAKKELVYWLKVLNLPNITLVSKYQHYIAIRRQAIACHCTALLENELTSYPHEVSDVAGCSLTQKTMFLQHQFRGDSRSNASLGLFTRFKSRPLTECNRLRLASMKFPFVLILVALSWLCDVSYVTMNEKFSWELSIVP